MPQPSPDTRTTRWRPSLATLAVVVACLGCGMEATASAGRPSHASKGGHRCKCGMDCVDRCCCAHDDPADASVDTKGSPTPNRTVARPGPAPCMTSAPCGGALPPLAGPLVLLLEPADRTSPSDVESPASRSLLAPPASDRAESPAGSRIDEPPERLGAA